MAWYDYVTPGHEKFAGGILPTSDKYDRTKNEFRPVDPTGALGAAAAQSGDFGAQGVQALAAGAIEGVIGLDDLSSYKPIPLLSDHVFSVPTAPVAPDSRIDIVEVKASYFATEPSSRMVLNPLTGEFAPGLINKILTWLIDVRVETISAPASATQPLAYKVGVPGNPGLAPATTAGYIKLHQASGDSGGLGCRHHQRRRYLRRKESPPRDPPPQAGDPYQYGTSR
jgi:hypothetical protein